MKSKLFYASLILLCLIVSCKRDDPAQEARAKLKPIIDAYFYAYNTGNVDTLDSICDPNVALIDGGTKITGIDSLKKNLKSTCIMFPDLKVTIDEEFYFDNRALLRWTCSGTNTGLGEFPPTGKFFKVAGISLCRFKDKKLVEDITESNDLNFLQQLGYKLIPPEK